jgi:hypothetical protein
MTDEEIERIHDAAGGRAMSCGLPCGCRFSESVDSRQKAHATHILRYARDHGYLAPLDTGYTATECSEIARKRYADEPRKTFQQQQYAHGLEHGYEHALFEHAGMMDRSRIVEAGDAMRRLLADDRSGNAHGFVMRCANNKEDTFWDVAKEVSVRCKEVVAAWDEAKK